MDTEEILKKARAENKNKDIYELEVLKQASTIATMVMASLAIIFFTVQMAVGGGTNWGLWALFFSADMTVFWVKYIRLHHKHELVMAIIYTIMIVAMSGFHIYNLVASSMIL